MYNVHSILHDLVGFKCFLKDLSFLRGTLVNWASFSCHWGSLGINCTASLVILIIPLQFLCIQDLPIETKDIYSKTKNKFFTLKKWKPSPNFYWRTSTKKYFLLNILISFSDYKRKLFFTSTKFLHIRMVSQCFVKVHQVCEN